MPVVRTVAPAVESVLEPGQTYLPSLGSRQGNAHLHRHIAGVPYVRQRFHALMTENGVPATTRRTPPTWRSASVRRSRFDDPGGHQPR
jgi:histidine triad (HIT) family protein